MRQNSRLFVGEDIKKQQDGKEKNFYDRSFKSYDRIFL